MLTHENSHSSQSFRQGVAKSCNSTLKRHVSGGRSIGPSAGEGSTVVTHILPFKVKEIDVDPIRGHIELLQQL